MTLAMMKKINIVFILSEIFSMIFFIHGVQRLYIASQGEKYYALLNNNFEKYYTLSNKQISDFMVSDAYWAIYAFIFYAFLIFFINYKYKIYHINSVIVIGIVFFLFPLGGFGGIVKIYLNYFCGLFGKSYGTSFLVGGSILTIIGILILWVTLKKYSSNFSKKQGRNERRCAADYLF